MKNLIKILVVLILTSTMYGCCGGSYKYTIKTDTNNYATNESITKEGNCIKFVPVGSKDPVTVCGSYTITENKNYKPPKK